jgi:type I restriction enzyme S subunit
MFNRTNLTKKKLIDISEIKKGKQLNKEHMLPNGKYFVLNGGVEPSGKTSDWNVAENTISISEGGNSCGYVSYNREKFWSGGHNYTLGKLKVNNLYLYNYLKAKENHLKALRVGSGLPNIQLSSLKDFEVIIYNEEEQQKIGAFLSALDELNEVENIYIDKLNNFKNYILSKIFEKQISFKNISGLKNENWTQSRLGNLGFFKTSSVDKLIKENERVVKLVNYMDVYKKRILNTFVINVLSNTSVKPKQLSENNLKQGDMLFTPSSETPDDIGNSAVILEDLPNTVYSYHLVRFRPKIELDLKFSNYVCNNNFVLKQMRLLAQGATRFTMSLSSMENVIIRYPIDLKEQKRIGSLLTLLDYLITLRIRKNTKLKELKKHYLNLIFNTGE